MTNSDDLTAPMRPSALHADDEPHQLSDEEAESFVEKVISQPYDKNHAGLWRLAWAYHRRAERHKRAEKRVEALKLSAVDVETLASAAASKAFGERYPHTTEALVRLLTAQRED